MVKHYKKIFVLIFAALIGSYGCIWPFKKTIDRIGLSKNIYGQWRFEMDYLVNDSVVNKRTGIVLFNRTEDKDSARTFELLMDNGSKTSSYGWYSIYGDSGNLENSFFYFKTWDSSLVFDGDLINIKKTTDKELKRDFKYSEFYCIDSTGHGDTLLKLNFNCLYNKTRTISH